MEYRFRPIPDLHTEPEPAARDELIEMVPVRTEPGGLGDPNLTVEPDPATEPGKGDPTPPALATTEPDPSLDELRRLVLASQAAGNGLPVTKPAMQVGVDPNGRIHLVAVGAEPTRPLAVISDEVFATRPSLDAIRDQVISAQREGETNPAGREKIVVDSTGQIGFEHQLGDGRPLSEVSQETFANTSTRLDRDRQTVASHLPSTTREMTVDSTLGWRYSFVNEFGEEFSMWAFFDGSLYQVALISPAVEGRAGAHDQHLFRDGYLCLSPRGGTGDLEGAYARSVLWANGYSAFVSTGVFPFSINNL